MEGDCISAWYIKNTNWAFVKCIRRHRGHRSQRNWAGTGFATLGASTALKYFGLWQTKAYFPSVAIGGCLWTVNTFTVRAKWGKPSENIKKAFVWPTNHHTITVLLQALLDFAYHILSWGRGFLYSWLLNLPRSCPRHYILIQQTSLHAEHITSAFYYWKHKPGLETRMVLQERQELTKWTNERSPECRRIRGKIHRRPVKWLMKNHVDVVVSW